MTLLRFRDDAAHDQPTVTLDAFLGQSNATAVRIEPGDDARALLPHLGRLALIEIAFPAFRDGRGYSAARILREAGYSGELRAEGDVLLDQVVPLRRCGFDAPVEPGRRSIWPRSMRRSPAFLRFIKRPPTAARRCGRSVMGEALRKLDLIDARPAFTQADADALNARFEGIETLPMLRALFAEGLLGRTAIVSSFGTESAVLLDLVARVDPSVPVIFVDTLKTFPETDAYRTMLLDRLGIANREVIVPDAAKLAASDPTGLRWSYDPDGCCEIRKVEPMARAKAGLDSWISGRKAFQSQTRAALPRFEIEDGRLKVNPLGLWRKDDLERYFIERDLPRHPLEAQGYASIGCSPCTSKVLPGEDPRAGRWRGWDKVECGIHQPIGPAEEPAF